MMVLRSPKGWTGPKVVDGVPIEGTQRAHQVPLTGFAKQPDHIGLLEDWLRSYRPEELFDGHGVLHAHIAALAPKGTRRMSANPHANGGVLLRDLRLPDFRDHAVPVDEPGASQGEATRVLGGFLREVMRLNDEQQNFRVMGPDETVSNRLGALFEVTNRTSVARIEPSDDHVAPDGRVTEVLSEHLCQGWFEGYLLTDAPRLLLVLRGLHPHHRFDVQPARQMAQGDAQDRLAPADPRSTTCSPATSGSRTTTGSATRTPASSTMR